MRWTLEARRKSGSTMEESGLALWSLQNLLGKARITGILLELLEVQQQAQSSRQISVQIFIAGRWAEILSSRPVGGSLLLRS